MISDMQFVEFLITNIDYRPAGWLPGGDIFTPAPDKPV